MTETDRQALLRIARDALTARVRGLLAPAIDMGAGVDRPAGVFVTLHLRGELRGCVGRLEPTEALGHVVARCAAAAGTEDPRFPAVDPSDLPELVVELSVLGTLELVDQTDDIQVGRHGLVIEKRQRRGLLLPQVAVERGWDRETFLAETCHKAGLSHEAWKEGASIWRFEAEVFSEIQPGGAGEDTADGQI